MRKHLKTIVATALLGPTFSLGVLAADGVSYPRTVGSGENIEVEYGPTPSRNIVGGGQMQVTGSGENAEVTYLEAGHAQPAPFGLMPTLRGSGENIEVVWVPNRAGDTMLAGRGFGPARN